MEKSCDSYFYKTFRFLKKRLAELRIDYKSRKFKLIVRKVSYLGAFSYIILGFLTIGSIINGTLELYINLIMGVFFIAIGYYLYLKAKSILKLITEIEDLNDEKQVNLNSIARFLFFEKIFVILSFLLGIILLSAVISRMFVENMPIFG